MSIRLGRLFLPLLLALAVVWPGLADAQRRGKAGVRRLRDMSSLRSAATRHPYTKKIVKKVLADRARTIDGVGEVEADRIAERLGWVPLGADPELRKVTVATVMRKVRQRSRGLRRLIKENPAQAAWDIVFVGAGVHTAIAANTLANLETDDPIRMLTVEAGDDIGGTFRDIGSTVGRNSANRAGRKGGKVKRGFGDKNPSEGPWGDPDLDGQEWPELGIMADTATVNLFASGSDFLLGSRVEKIDFRDDVAGSDSWPARYRLTLGDGTAVYANAVARATGLGKPKLGITDPQSVALIESERQKVDVRKPDEVPELLHYVEALKLANASRQGRDPYRARPAPVRPFVELSGVRIKTSQRTVLRTNDNGEVPLDEAIDIAFDPKASTWSVQLLDGRKLSVKRLVAEVANREIVLQPTDKLEDLASKLEALALPDQLRVARQQVRKRVRPPAYSSDERLSQIKQRLGLGDLTGIQIRNEANGFEPASEIEDVFSEAPGQLTVVRRDGTRFRLANGLRLSRLTNGNRSNLNPIAADDPLFAQPGDPSRPVIAVIGGRDSGRTFLEYLYGQAPAAAYTGGGKVDTAQRGEIGDVEWYVGENGPADCDTFLKSTRSRYLRLAGKIRDAGDGTRARAQLNKVRITKVSKLPTGRYLITDSANQTKIVDRVIFATGFDNQLAEDGQLDPINGTVEGLSGDRVVAKRVRGRDIFRFGPAAGDDLVAADERYSTDENSGSIYALGPRDRAFARTVLARTVRAIAAIDTPALERPVRLTLAEGQTEAIIEAPETVAARRLETPLSDLVLRAEMMDALASVRGAKTRDRLSFRVTRDKQSKKLKIEDLNHDGADKISELIRDSALLYDQLEEATEDGDSVEFSIPLRNGVPARSKLKVNM
jgi:hypothetical protein